MNSSSEQLVGVAHAKFIEWRHTFQAMFMD